MPSRLPDEGTIDELLGLARVSIDDHAARSWMKVALPAAQAIAASVPRPSPVEHNAPLDTIERAAKWIIAALDELRRHPHAHGNFWRFASFRPFRASVERTDFMSALESIPQAAREARVSKTGRPPNLIKQRIVNFMLAFSARYSSATPSGDINNFFRQLAERFYELSTGLSVEGKGHGIGRQISAALHLLPIEMQRAELLKKTSSR
jgi:hypothetical protein